MSNVGDSKTKDGKDGGGNMEEPPDLSLEEQAEHRPARDLDSKTEDFETNATVTGMFPLCVRLMMQMMDESMSTSTLRQRI